MTPRSTAAELELRAVLDAAVDAIIVIDARGRIETFSRAAEQLFGYEAAEVVGRNVSMLMPDPYRSKHDQYIGNYLRTGEERIIGRGREVVACRRDGSCFPISLAVGRIESEPEPRFVGFIHDISARVQAVEELRRARDRAQSYLDLAEVMLLALDARGHISLINRKGAEMLGWREDELVGRDWFETCIPPDIRDGLRQRFDDRISGKALSASTENEVLTRDGHRRLIAWRTVQLGKGGPFEGTLSSGEDVTEQRAALAALHKSERLLRQAQALAGLGNYEAWVPDGEVNWSDEMYRILGRDPERGPPGAEEFLVRYVDPGDKDRFRRRWQEVSANGGIFDMEFHAVRDDGEQLVVHAAASVVRRPDGTLHVTGTLHDITERHSAVEEMRQAQERLTQFARLSTMGEMAAGLAHEINQPLTAITTFSQALQRLVRAAEEPDKEEVTDVLEQIASQALRAGEIIRRLRGFVRTREVRQEAVATLHLIEETLAFADPDARLSNIVVRLNVPDSLPPIHCDPIQIQQVLLNLVRNAIDATNETDTGQREIAVAARVVGDGDVEVSVSDHGPGISREVAVQLGNPFFTTKDSGTGLGIAISRSILRAHGGQFGHRPTPGGGATVFFTLPAAGGEQS